MQVIVEFQANPGSRPQYFIVGISRSARHGRVWAGASATDLLRSYARLQTTFKSG